MVWLDSNSITEPPTFSKDFLQRTQLTWHASCDYWTSRLAYTIGRSNSDMLPLTHRTSVGAMTSDKAVSPKLRSRGAGRTPRSNSLTPHHNKVCYFGCIVLILLFYKCLLWLVAVFVLIFSRATQPKSQVFRAIPKTIKLVTSPTPSPYTGSIFIVHPTNEILWQN